MKKYYMLQNLNKILVIVCLLVVFWNSWNSWNFKDMHCYTVYIPWHFKAEVFNTQVCQRLPIFKTTRYILAFLDHQNEIYLRKQYQTSSKISFCKKVLLWRYIFYGKLQKGETTFWRIQLSCDFQQTEISL